MAQPLPEAVKVVEEDKSTIIPYIMDLVVDVKENGEGTIKINKLTYTKHEEGIPITTSETYGTGQGISNIGEAAEGIKNTVMKELFPDNDNGNEAQGAQASKLLVAQDSQALPPPPPEKEQAQAPVVVQAEKEPAPAAAPAPAPAPAPAGVQEPLDDRGQPLPSPPPQEPSAQATALKNNRAELDRLIAAGGAALDKARNNSAFRAAAGKASKAVDDFKKKTGLKKGGSTTRRRRAKQTKKYCKRASTRTRRSKPFYFFN